MYALIAYTLLAVALTWPLVTQVGAVVPRDLGDPLLSTWMLSWNAHVLPFSEAWWNAPFFFPSRHAVAFSDHRVGIGLLTTPLIWAGASPLAAYDVAFIASFVLSAGAAYALCLSLTKSRSAAFVGGLVFGFHPFRAAHLEHLELLSSYWLPLALLFLHRWTLTRSRLTLLAVAAALTLQALTCGYYFFFAGVLLIGWLAWFALRGAPWQDVAQLAAALAAPLVAVAPILWRYRQAHAELGLSRSITEIEQLSADIAGLWTPPQMLALWNTASPTGSPEGALFPGVVAVGVVLLALWRRPRAAVPPSWRSVRLGLAVVTMALTGVGVLSTVLGPLAFRIGPLRISVSSPYKPVSAAVFVAIAWLLTSPRVRDAWTRRSPFAFYVLATLAMWMLALGPTARLFGTPVIYKAPYAWLMTLPGFADAFRAPARFAMLAALTLGVAAALALNRVTSGLGRRAHGAAWLLVAGGVIADGWIAPLPLPAPPASLSAIQGLPPGTLVMEAPLGTFEDAAAMYRAMGHGRPLVNGLSGYEPPHYTVLRCALTEGRLDAAASVAPEHDLAVVVARTPDGARFAETLARLVPAATVTRTADADVFRLPRQTTPAARPDAGARVPVRDVSASTGPVDLARLLDDDMRTGWQTPARQVGGEQLVIDLGEPADVAALVLAQGKATFMYPRIARVELSTDRQTWTSAWEGDLATPTLRAALDVPAVVPVRLTFPAAPARFVRITQIGQAPHPWAMAELAVFGPASAKASAGQARVTDASSEGRGAPRAARVWTLASARATAGQAPRHGR